MLEFAAVLEGIGPDGGKVFRKTDVGKFGTAVEHAVADGGNAGEGDGGEGGTSGKGVATDGEGGGRDAHRGQVAALVEGIGSNLRHAVGEFEGFDFRSHECGLSDADDFVGEEEGL